MAKKFDALDDAHRAFIAKQHVFFTASAAPGSRINLSPKDARSLRVVDDNTVIYLDQTGSGNETAAHMLADGRLTIMMTAFEGLPLIFRMYGRGSIIARGSGEYDALLVQHFGGDEPPGARQIVRLSIELIQTSCGYGVPLMDYVDERPNLIRWAEAKGEAGVEEYRKGNNVVSLDGLDTGYR